MANPPLMGYSIKDRETLQELPEKSPVSGKRKRKLLLEIEKKENKKSWVRALSTIRAGRARAVQVGKCSPEN